jgi:ABC-2 type transport system permease protein
VSLQVALATSGRLLVQLRRDLRAVLLVVAAPAVVLALLRWLYAGDADTYDRVGVSLLGVLPFAVMTLAGAAIVTRERASGSLDRLLELPIGRLDVVTGYIAALAVLAAAGASLATAVTLGPLGAQLTGSAYVAGAVAVIGAAAGSAVGVLVGVVVGWRAGAGARLAAALSVAVAQVVLCGVLVERADLPAPLRVAADALPATYAVDAENRLTLHDGLGSAGRTDVIALALAVVVAAMVAAAGLRRGR